MTKKIIPANSYSISHDLVDHDALYVIKKLHKHGFDGYIVGGGTRDLMLHKTPKDFDIVTNATPELVRKIFRENAIIIGRRFKIVHIVFSNINPDKIVNNRPLIERHILEVSTYRSSTIHQHNLNAHGKIMIDNNYGSQEEDAARRDFTINALYYDPLKEIIIDYHNGLQDIKNQTIRMIGDPLTRYTEDPVRMLRAIRLSVKLGLQIDHDTENCFTKIKQLLTHEPRSRLYEEMLKILLSGQSYNCMQKLKQVGLPKDVFPLFDKLFFKNQQDTLALNILQKTDARLVETNDVSIIFILAGLMWEMVYYSWQETILNGGAPRQALLEAIHQNKKFAYDIGITKNAFNYIREVWLLQFDFENPSPKRIDLILNNPRFRQAWHLYSARYETTQVEASIYKWWSNFIEGNQETRLVLLDQLATLILPSKKKARKRKPKRIYNSTT